VQRIDTLIHNGTIVTMDLERRVLENHSVAVDGGKILDIGPVEDLQRRYQAAKTLDAHRHVIMPGMVDLHAHAGTSLLKGIGERLPGGPWRNVMDFVAYNTSEEWWYVESLLASLEKLKCGTTTSLYMLGCAPRGDSPGIAYRNAEAVDKIGIRSVCGIGPSRPPWPRVYTYWDGKRRVEREITLEETFDQTDEAIGSWNARADSRVKLWVSVSRMLNENPNDPVYDPENRQYIRPQLEGISRIMRKHDVGFHVHAYGTAGKFLYQNNEFSLLGPKTVLAHGWPFDLETVDILAKTDTRVAHCPRARRVYHYSGRLPLPELIKAGVTVGIGSDACGNDRPFDSLFEDMFIAPRWQRLELHDPYLLPPGKMLEMATIDGAKALGMDDRIGSIEVGKDADIILIDMYTPQAVPLVMETSRLASLVRGADVKTVMVQGQILMEDRKVKTVNEGDVCEWAQQEALNTIDVFGLRPLMEPSVRQWGASRTSPERSAARQ
jgi:cytosine/adenosine deaminase-related metal-dependent hydrolase